MGKLFGKKGDGDEDSNRLALFGSRSKSKSPAPPANNPYAQPAIPPDPYTQAKMNAGIVPSQGPSNPRPQPTEGRYGGMERPPPQEKRPYGNNDRYGPPQDSYGYSSNKFGNEKGYGASGDGGNPYGGYGQTSGPSQYGNYGGYGASAGDPYDNGPDENRDALFGGASQRLQRKQDDRPPSYMSNPGGSSEEPSYGGYEDRQLTAEEIENEDVDASKQEIKFIKQQDVSSTRNALRMAAMAEETGRNTLARLGAQGERLHNTNRNLDIANNHINIAEDKAKELKTLNRSMFAVHMNNPFTSKERRIQREEKIMDRHESEREQREATREQAFKAGQRMNQNFKSLGDSGFGTGTGSGSGYKPNLAERAKYQFEADSDDDRMEDEIDRNLDELGGAAKRLNLLARATGEEVDAQNKIIRGIAEKVSLDSDLHSPSEHANHVSIERQRRQSCSSTDRKTQAYQIDIVLHECSRRPWVVVRLALVLGYMGKTVVNSVSWMS